MKELSKKIFSALGGVGYGNAACVCVGVCVRVCVSVCGVFVTGVHVVVRGYVL